MQESSNPDFVSTWPSKFVSPIAQTLCIDRAAGGMGTLNDLAFDQNWNITAAFKGVYLQARCASSQRSVTSKKEEVSRNECSGNFSQKVPAPREVGDRAPHEQPRFVFSVRKCAVSPCAKKQSRVEYSPAKARGNFLQNDSGKGFGNLSGRTVREKTLPTTTLPQVTSTEPPKRKKQKDQV